MNFIKLNECIYFKFCLNRYILFRAQLVPVYSFGENNIYNQVNNPRGSFLRGLQDRIRRWLNFAPVLFYGRGIFQYSFGFLPFRRKITTVSK